MKSFSGYSNVCTKNNIVVMYLFELITYIIFFEKKDKRNAKIFFFNLFLFIELLFLLYKEITLSIIR